MKRAIACTCLTFFVFAHTFYSPFHTVDKDGNQVWKKMLEPTSNPNFIAGEKNSTKEVAMAFVAIAGEKTSQKLRLANAMFCDWQLNLKMKKKKRKKADENFSDPCPFYQPSTQNMELRAFFGRLKKHHNFKFRQEDFSGFHGSLNGMMEEIYEQRVEQYVSEKKF